MSAASPMFPTPHREVLLTAQEVAHVLRVSKGWVYDLIETGQLASVRIGKRAVRVRPADLDEYIESR